MTSQLNVDTIVDKAGSGGTNVKIGNTSTYVSDGGGATQNTVQSLAKVWSNLEQASTYSTRDSFNLSSHGDETTGVSLLTFTTNFGNAHHATSSMASNINNVAGNDNDSLVQTTSQIRIGVYDVGNNSHQDSSYLTVSIHGDLS